MKSRLLCFVLAPLLHAATPNLPNIVLIYADDLGYGDLGCYGATAIPTPHIDALAAQGVRFTDAYATSSTCQSSRYGLLTGIYPWRLKGNAAVAESGAMIIPPGTDTLASVLKNAGYHTGVVGKWHLGLGTPEEPVDWNAEIKAGPSQVGFDYHYIMASNADRVPTVYVENNRVVNADRSDPIRVSFQEKVGVEPTGKDDPGLRTFGADKEHNGTIVNGVSRIGFLAGGKGALWKDEELGDELNAKALAFIEKHKDQPFFLYYAPHEPHVPRIPAPRFVGKTQLGPRGDAIAQLDAHVGAVMEKLKMLDRLNNTLIVLTSDNGPVLDDGYEDRAVEKNGSHMASGKFSGGKYSKLEGGCRVPLIVSWPGGKVNPRVSQALVSQIDFLASLAVLTKQKQPKGDGRDKLSSLLGRTNIGREWVIQQGMSGLAIRAGDWKYIPPHDAASKIKGIRSGNSPQPQLFNLAENPEETRNLAGRSPSKIKELGELLASVVGPK